MSPDATSFGLDEIPTVPPGTPPVDVITSLGFNPATVQAVVITGDSIIGISAAIPGGPPPTPEPDPEPGPDPI